MVEDVAVNPAVKANVALVLGEQGCGKTTYVVGVCVDAYRESLAKHEASVRGHRKDIALGKEPRKIVPVRKIFTNFSLFGIKHVKFTIADLIGYLEDDLVRNAIVAIDEASITADARKSQDAVVVLLTQYGMQMRKRNVELYFMVQHGKMLDWRFRFIKSRTIECKYSKITHKIKVLITSDSGKTKQFSFHARQYWRNFRTNELPEIPKKTIERALAKVS